MATGTIHFGYRSIPAYRFRFITFYILHIYIHTQNKKIKKKRGKMVNDIVSITRITSTKLTFRATLPLQILTTGIKERKKPNTYLILVFSSLVPHLFFSLIYFFLHAWSFFFFFLTLNINFASTKKNYIHGLAGTPETSCLPIY